MSSLSNDLFTELAFRDLSVHSEVFRKKLIDEFQILDNIAESTTTAAPQYTSRDIRDVVTLRKLLLEDPFQLIKFQPLKRTFAIDTKKKDRRLTKTKNINSLPVGAWAGWVVESKLFTRIIVFLIILTSILSGVSAELADSHSQHWQTFQIISLIDSIALIFFITEILLRWLDDFNRYWKDGWNVFDFVITIGSAVPNFIEWFSDGGSDGFLRVLLQIKAFRVLRSLKIISRFGSLKVIILTTFQAMTSLSVIVVLVVVVAFIYGIIGINLFAHFTNNPDVASLYHTSFANLGNSMFTLFQLLTLDKWDQMSTDISSVISPAITYTYVITWVWLGAFIFRNVFVGVMVTDFDRIRKQMADQEIEYVKQRKFDKMRKKLNKELETQVGMKSISSLSSETAPVPNPLPIRNIKGSAILDTPTQDDDLKESFESIKREMSEEEWEAFVVEAMQGLIARTENTKWPRDTLFKYLQLMENLQENMREFEELNLLASSLLLDLHDD